MALNPNEFQKTIGKIRSSKEIKSPSGPSSPLVRAPGPVPKTKDGLTLPEQITLRNKKAREQMAKKVSKDGKPYLFRLGYNHCIGQFAPHDGEYPILTGSSLNRKPAKKKSKPKPPSGPVEHYFSPRSKGKVKDKATAFYRSIPGERIFLTLTFIEHVEDARGNKILNKFLTVVRKECKGFQYLRIAEHQELNPAHTIHFHVLMNKRLAVRRYNALWVLQQYNDGLVGHRADGSEISREEIEERYQKGKVGQVLNPLDVRKAYGINGLASYLTKYVTKQKREPFGCLNWHCSRRVSKLFTKELVSPSAFAYLRTFNNYRVDRKTGECFPAKVYAQTFFQMVYVHNKGAPLLRLRQMEKANKWIINDFEPGVPSRITDAMYRKTWYRDPDRQLVT